MSRDFSGTAQYAQIDSAPVTAAPFTFTAWVWSDSSGGNIFWLGDKDVTNHYWTLMFNSTGPSFRLVCDGGVSTNNATAGTTAPTGRWIHVTATVTSDVSRRCDWYDPSDGATSAGSSGTSRTPSGVDRIAIGQDADSSPGGRFNGRIAHAALWDRALSQAEREGQQRGQHPMALRPLCYWPLTGDVSPEPDLMGGYPLTLTGPPTKADSVLLRGGFGR